jgi:transposase
MIMAKRIVGIDLAVAGLHRAAVYDSGRMSFVGKSFAFNRSYEGFMMLVDKAASGFRGELWFVMEPTSGAWKALSAFLIAKGYTVYLVKPQKVYDLRKFLRKHTKSDRIDAQTMAKLPIVDPQGIYPLTLPKPDVVALNRYCRQRERIMRSICGRKTRIQAYFTAVNPLLMECFGEHKYTHCCRAFLRCYADPFKVVKLSVEQLAGFLTRHAWGTPEPKLAEKIYNASQSAVSIFKSAKAKGMLPFEPEQFQDEINIELDLMEYEEKKIMYLDKKIQALYQRLDPQQVLQSIPGIGPVHAPSILSVTGNPARFTNLRAYKAFCGLVPRKKQSATQDIKGLRITKSSQRMLKKSYCLAAETARRYDPEAACMYHRLRARGRHHNQAICAVASNLAGRTYSVMKRNRLGTDTQIPVTRKYIIHDFAGKDIDLKQGRALVVERYLANQTGRAPNGFIRGSLSRQVEITPHEFRGYSPRE